MSGYHPVLVIGETPKQYRIEAIERMTPVTGPLFAGQKGRKPAHAMRAGPRRHPGLATKPEGFCTTRPHSCLMAAA
jgi:hypothetical protein